MQGYRIDKRVLGIKNLLPLKTKQIAGRMSMETEKNDVRQRVRYKSR